MAKKFNKSKAVTEETIESFNETVSPENMRKKHFFLWPLAIIFSLGFMLYVQTANYQYALDDKLVITHNYITKKGFKGITEHMQTDFLVGFFGKQKNLLAGGRYRPLSLIVFSIENQIFGSKKQNEKGQFVVDKDGDQIYEYNPMYGHLTNGFMYALTAVVLFLVLIRLFPPNEKRAWYLSLPFLATLLWTAHPLHTEVVANIKGRDEIMSLMFALATLFFSLKYLEKKDVKQLVFSALMFMLAVLSKETTITFIAVVPMTIYFFSKEDFKGIVKITAPLVITFLIYFVAMRIPVLGNLSLHMAEGNGLISSWFKAYDFGMRSNPVPELMNDPFMHAKNAKGGLTSAGFATIFFTLGLYLKLLVFPHPLTHDYYPWHPVGDYIHGTGQPYPYLTWADPAALLSLIAYGFLIYWGIKGLKSRSVWAYCIWFYLGNLFLVSNLVFPVGTFLNERFMYVPSIGFVIMVAYFLIEHLPKKMKDAEKYRKYVMGTLAVLLIGYSGKTISRNTSWENDFALSVGDVNVSFKSAKSNMSAGLALVDESKKYKKTDTLKQQRMLNQAVKHLALSLNIYPTYIQPMLIMGNAYYEKEDYENAIVYFEKCLKLNPSYEYATKNLEHVGDLCVKKKQIKTGIKSYQTLLKYYRADEKRVNAKLAQAYSASGDNANTKKYLQGEITTLTEQLKEDPNNFDVLIRLGEYYGKNLKDLQNSRKYLEKAYQVKPENADVMQKLGVVYAMSGEAQKAIEMFKKALEKNPTNAHILMNIGIAYRNLGDETTASTYLNKAFEIDPNLRTR